MGIVLIHCVCGGLLWQQQKISTEAHVTWIETPGALSSVETFLSKFLILQDSLLP